MTDVPDTRLPNGPFIDDDVAGSRLAVVVWAALFVLLIATLLRGQTQPINLAANYDCATWIVQPGPLEPPTSAWVKETAHDQGERFMHIVMEGRPTEEDLKSRLLVLDANSSIDDLKAVLEEGKTVVSRLKERKERREQN